MSDESLATRLTRIKADPEFMDKVCAHVAGSGTLIDLCKTWEVPYGLISSYIHADEERSRRYRASTIDREEWFVEQIIQQLKKIGFSDVASLFNEDGSLKAPSEWPKEISSVIASIETDELYEGTGRERKQIGHTKKIKLWDKNKSIEMLGKYFKMFAERHVHEGKVTLEQLVAGSMKPGDKK